MSQNIKISDLAAATTLSSTDALAVYVFTAGTFGLRRITFQNFAATLTVSTATQAALDALSDRIAVLEAGAMNRDGSNATLPDSDPATGGSLFGAHGGSVTVSAG